MDLNKSKILQLYIKYDSRLNADEKLLNLSRKMKNQFCRDLYGYLRKDPLEYIFYVRAFKRRSLI